MKINLLFILCVNGFLVLAQDSGYKEHYEPSPYHYVYKVNDEKVYLDFGAEEEGDGKGDVHGFYHVRLPDGRLQRVSYHVNDYSGYIAEVTYDGEAHHPAYHGHGGGHIGGHRLGKALVHQPQSDRVGKAFNTPRVDQSFDETAFSPLQRRLPETPRSLDPAPVIAPEPRDLPTIATSESEAAKTPETFEEKDSRIKNKEQNFGKFNTKKVFTNFGKSRKGSFLSKPSFFEKSREGFRNFGGFTEPAKPPSFEKEVVGRQKEANEEKLRGGQPVQQFESFKSSINTERGKSFKSIVNTEPRKSFTSNGNAQPRKSFKSSLEGEPRRFAGFQKNDKSFLRKDSNPPSQQRKKASLIVHRRLSPQ